MPGGSQPEESRSKQKSYTEQQNKAVYRQEAFRNNTDFIERYLKKRLTVASLAFPKGTFHQIPALKIPQNIT